MHLPGFLTYRKSVPSRMDRIPDSGYVDRGSPIDIWGSPCPAENCLVAFGCLFGTWVWLSDYNPKPNLEIKITAVCGGQAVWNWEEPAIPVPFVVDLFCLKYLVHYHLSGPPLPLGTRGIHSFSVLR
ncbi:hypothetical protein MLD38_022499 [Melastoma candidum]|uniref:Uncharacterized protein n=1 Tax=Melastoma candidum TaxID=119954 RepID=A0ACB9QK10_9MYRT|nr:hypothetical protein MLD38_022499 [Melastoma candidum]